MTPAEPVSRHTIMADDDYHRDLGDGLVLRWTTPQDLDRVVALYEHVFRQNPEAPLNPSVAFWTRDMFSGRHPNIGPRDFAVVEHTRSGALAACTCLLRYTCRYEGVPFGFGRPELVASLPEYRRRGLVRAIFSLVHARSETAGDLVQGITGIPYYYRQFGYEYAAVLEDDVTVYFPAIPALKPGSPEPYTLREASLDDIPLLQRLWARTHAEAAVWTDIEEDYWRWAMAGTDPAAMERWRVYLIADSAGRKVGALTLFPGRRGAALSVHGPMVESGTPLVRVMPSVLRALQALATTVKARPESPAAGAITFRYADPSLRGSLAGIPFVEPYPYAWYLRVHDLPRFLRHIAPALERRLAASSQSGYTGDLTIDFYRGGLRIVFDHGRLAQIEDWHRPIWGEAMAGYPPLVFLQSLFGHRSFHELRSVFPDVWAEGDATALLDALFPKRPAMLMYLD